MEKNPNILKMLALLEQGPATSSQLAFELGLEPSKSKKAAWQIDAYIACLSSRRRHNFVAF